MFKPGNPRRHSSRFEGAGVQLLEGRVLLSVTPSLVANRVSGVAPLAVHFDATGTTSTATVLPFHEVQYEWDFGDSGSGIWDVSGKSRNTDSGMVAGHVYDQPGTYTVTLNVRDPDGSIASETVTIDVQDPEAVFAGTNTIVFSTVGDFSGAPAGALQVTTGSLATIASYAAPGKRLLLHRGESWNNAAAVTINQLGPGILGAYGAGPKPHINLTGGDRIFSISGRAWHMDDWRFVDLSMSGSSGALGFNLGGTADNLLFYRLDFSNFNSGIVASPSILDSYNSQYPNEPQHTLHNGNAVVDSTIDNGAGPGGNGMFVAGQRMLILGNTITRYSANEHVLRTPWLQKTVIGNNFLSTPNSGKHNLKLHAPQWGGAGLGFHQYSEQLVISDNIFEGADNPWIVCLGPQDNLKDERVRDVIFENNFVKGNAGSGAGLGTQVGLFVWASQVTARNNVFTLFANDAAVRLGKRGIEPAADNNRILNNTVYYSGSGTAVIIDAAASNTTVVNNLVSKTGAVVSNAGTGSVISNNLVTATAGFVSATPTQPADFALRYDSPARDAGATVPFWNDFGDQLRPESLYDVGAWEMVDLLAPTVVIDPPAADSVTITFSETVSGFDLADLILTRDGGANLLTGAGTLSSSDSKTFVLSGLAGLTQTAGSYALTLSAGGSGITDLPGNALASGAVQNWQAFASVAGRWVFYNNSYFDGGDPAANALDDGAIAPDKAALLPGQTATFANYTSYSRGINGLMLDILGLPEAGLTASDFEFRVGNDGLTPDPLTWAAAAAPLSVSIRRGAGAGGSDRVELIWTDNVIQKQWLQVKAMANANTGLLADDVFYFGNAVGETGNSTTSARVDSSDEIGARQHPKTPSNPAIITDAYDFNRDHLVNSVDQLIARNNKTTPSTELKLIQVPA